jgi:hypothetical protein
MESVMTTDADRLIEKVKEGLNDLLDKLHELPKTWGFDEYRQDYHAKVAEFHSELLKWKVRLGA